MPSLFVVRGRDQGKHFQLSDLVYRIGRDAGSDIQLLDTEASRNHAEIHVDQQTGCELVDLGSSNGTKINGEKIARHKLASGDRIEIGGTLLIYTGTGQPTAMEAAHSVDIVRQARENDRSRIVSQISPPATKSQSLDLSDSAVLSRADRSLEVMYLTAIAVGRANDLDELLNRILRLVFDWVEADRGCIMLRDPESSELQPAARCDRARVDDDQPQHYRLAISHTILDYVMEHKKGVRTSDARDDDRFENAASIVQAGVREAICVPLQGRYGIVGALYIDTYISPGERIATGIQQRFNDDHLRLITAIGHQAALAIEDTFYYSALVQSERLAAMGQTIATLSHHIKNILQGIRGGSYLIEAGLDRDDSEAVRRGWGMVDRNQQRISNLVLDMLTFSKEREPEKVEADWNETARDVVELMQSRADEMRVSLESDLSKDIPQAMFDPDAMHRAVLNLVTNAIDAAAGTGDTADETDFAVDDTTETAGEPRETPRVLVKTGFDPTLGWYIDVVDNGPGIAPAEREKIFSLFESSKGARGTGLGLPVSEKIMREHGGEIQVLDSGDLCGSCFRLRLPPTGTDMDMLTGTGAKT